MGLDTTHDCWHGSCGGFNLWRNAVAEAAGYPLIPEDGSSTDMSPDLPWDEFPRENYAGEWDQAPADPVLILLVHSDCGGLIHPEHAAVLADRLEELLPKVPDGSGDPWMRDWRLDTEVFIKGLREAAARNEAVEFN